MPLISESLTARQQTLAADKDAQNHCTAQTMERIGIDNFKKLKVVITNGIGFVSSLSIGVLHQKR